jgi:hypothetical protein
MSTMQSTPYMHMHCHSELLGVKHSMRVRVLSRQHEHAYTDSGIITRRQRVP